MPSGQRLQIVHLDTGLELRGGQRQLFVLARGFRQRGHTQLIVCPDGSAAEAQGRREGFDVFPLPAHDPAHAYGIVELRQHLKFKISDLKFQMILHAHDGRSQTLAWLASLGMAVRRLASRRVTFLPRDRVSHRLKYTYTCHAVVAVSKYIRQLLVWAGVPESKIEVIPDGIEVPAELPPPEARARIRARWGFREKEFVIGHLGAFTPEKGQDIALDAFQRLMAKLPDARLLLAGEGPARTSPAIIAKVAGAAGRAQLCGSIEKLAEFFPALDLFVMPSRSEGLGTSVLWAMAYGLPVVASRVGGLPEVITDDETGWLVPPESPKALAEAIYGAAANSARRVQFGQNARARARQFSAEVVLNRTEALYYRLLSGSAKSEI
jgi:glycosyltransferase involved in cell wall biosynthesis